MLGNTSDLYRYHSEEDQDSEINTKIISTDISSDDNTKMTLLSMVTEENLDEVGNLQSSQRQSTRSRQSITMSKSDHETALRKTSWHDTSDQITTPNVNGNPGAWASKDSGDTESGPFEPSIGALWPKIIATNDTNMDSSSNKANNRALQRASNRKTLDEVYIPPPPKRKIIRTPQRTILPNADKETASETSLCGSPNHTTSPVSEKVEVRKSKELDSSAEREHSSNTNRTNIGGSSNITASTPHLSMTNRESLDEVGTLISLHRQPIFPRQFMTSLNADKGKASGKPSFQRQITSLRQRTTMSKAAHENASGKTSLHDTPDQKSVPQVNGIAGSRAHNDLGEADSGP